MPKATGSAPIVNPPIAVASGGITASAASATSRIPSGRHAVCFVSRNHVLLAPGLEREVAALDRVRQHVVAQRSGDRVHRRATVAARIASPPMDIADVCIFTEPQQGASYDDLLAVARRAESLGFGGFFRSDHFLKMGGVSGLPGPTDALVTLAGLARDTTRIRLGTLVCSATFRHAGVLAVSIAEIDHMSGGRVELGLGAGWYGQEHDSHAIPFPPLGERFEVFEDQLAIVTGMWATPPGETFSLLRAGGCPSSGSPGLPKPLQQPHPPIIVGGDGTTRTPRLAAQYASEFNRAFAPVDNFREVGRACT